MLPEISDLHVGYNILKSLPSDIGYLKKLIRLKANNNKISILPASFGEMEALEEVELQCNNIATIPDSIGNCKKLRRLNLSSNELSFLPGSMSNLINLQWLDLSRNQLVSLALIPHLKPPQLTIGEGTCIEDWVERIDPITGAVIYYNAKTKESSYTLPKAGDDEVERDDLWADWREQHYNKMEDNVGKEGDSKRYVPFSLSLI